MPRRHVLPLNGSREGLFSAIFPALARKPGLAAPAVLIPNPFYQAYAAAAAASGAVPALPAEHRRDGLPARARCHRRGTARAHRRALSLLALQPARRGRVAHLSCARPSRLRAATTSCCSPTNATRRSTARRRRPARSRRPTPRAEASPMSWRSSRCPSARACRACRSGFVAGDPEFIAAFGRFRNVACPQVPLPVQHVSVAAWSDEEHVEKGRALYRANFDLADAILGPRYGYRRPGGAFFLWLNLAKFGGGERAATTLWKDCGVRVLPGAYLAQARTRRGQSGHGLCQGRARA